MKMRPESSVLQYTSLYLDLMSERAEDPAVQLNDCGERMLEEPSDTVSIMGDCMEALVRMPAVLGLVSRWEMMGQEVGKQGIIQGFGL